MYRLYLLLFISFIVISCSNTDSKNKEKQLRWLGDIPFDKSSDRKDFEICNGEENIMQYFNVGNSIEIEGDKPFIYAHFKNGYNPAEMPAESGLIRIRFVVNCKGETDRFRILESDLNYVEKKFDKRITEKLLQLTQSLKGWKQKLKDGGEPIDYYQYLIFRLVDGNITKILP